MARKLPVRLHEKHGRFYYVHRNKWVPLSRDYGEALRMYAGLMAPSVGMMPDLLDRYIGGLTVAAKTLKTYTVCAKRLKVAFTAFRPDQVKPSHLYQYLSAKQITPAMSAHYRSVMVGAMQLALRDGLVEQNLMREVEQFSGGKRDRYLTDAEFAAIRKEATETMRTIMDIAYITGQRIMDVLSIKYADLTQEGIFFLQEKTKARLLVEWNPDLTEAVETAKSLHKSVKGLTLFHTRQGKPFSYWTIRTLWNRACKAAKVSNARMHDIRAKAATDAKRQGIDSKALLGHKSEAVHQRYLRDKEVPIVQGVKPSSRVK